MAQTNIYDYIIAELIRRLLGAASNIAVTSLALSSNLGSNQIIAGNVYNSTTFTSEILNLPTGWTVVADSHVITTPGFSDITGSSTSLVAGVFSISLPTAGDTLVVTSTVDITDGTDTVTLSTSLTITAVNEFYYGVKTYAIGQTVAGLTEVVGGNNVSFTFSAPTAVGRLCFARHIDDPAPVAIEDNHGNTWFISEFSINADGDFRVYQSNWDTQLTSSVQTTFTLKYA